MQIITLSTERTEVLLTADKDSGGGSVIAVRNGRHSIRRRDLEMEDECVWVETRTDSGENMLISNHYFGPDFPLQRFKEYMEKLECSLSTSGCRVIILGNFNAPNINWKE